MPVFSLRFLQPPPYPMDIIYISISIITIIVVFIMFWIGCSERCILGNAEMNAMQWFPFGFCILEDDIAARLQSNFSSRVPKNTSTPATFFYSNPLPPSPASTSKHPCPSSSPWSIQQLSSTRIKLK